MYEREKLNTNGAKSQPFRCKTDLKCLTLAGNRATKLIAENIGEVVLLIRML